MSRTFPIVCKAGLVALAILALSCPAQAQEGSWAGKIVLIKRTGVKLSDDAGKVMPEAVLGEMVVKALDDKNGSIKLVSHHGAEGWCKKTEAVLLDNAVGYFSGLIKKNPKDAAAYYGRSVAHRLTGDLEQALKDSDSLVKLYTKAPSFVGARQHPLCDEGL